VPRSPVGRPSLCFWFLAYLHKDVGPGRAGRTFERGSRLCFPVPFLLAAPGPKTPAASRMERSGHVGGSRPVDKRSVLRYYSPTDTRKTPIRILRLLSFVATRSCRRAPSPRPRPDARPCSPAVPTFPAEWLDYPAPEGGR